MRPDDDDLLSEALEASFPASDPLSSFRYTDDPDSRRELSMDSLPPREGPPPAVTQRNPQMQLDQFPDQATHSRTFEAFANWPDVILRPSLRAPPGTIGLFLPEEDAKGRPDAYLLGREFAHLHPLPDGSLHMTLPDAARAAAMSAGWAIPHPLAGYPSVSRQTVLVYAPRSDAERRVVWDLVAQAEAFARGQVI